MPVAIQDKVGQLCDLPLKARALRGILGSWQPVLQRQFTQLQQLLPPGSCPGQVLQLLLRVLGGLLVPRAQHLGQHSDDDGVDAGHVGAELAGAVRADAVRQKRGKTIQDLVNTGDLAIEMVLSIKGYLIKKLTFIVSSYKEFMHVNLNLPQKETKG